MKSSMSRFMRFALQVFVLGFLLFSAYFGMIEGDEMLRNLFMFSAVATTALVFLQEYGRKPGDTFVPKHLAFLQTVFYPVIVMLLAAHGHFVFATLFVVRAFLLMRHHGVEREPVVMHIEIDAAGLQRYLDELYGREHGTALERQVNAAVTPQAG